MLVLLPRTEADLERSCRLLLTEPSRLSELQARVRAGEDPLGEAFCFLRSARVRRQSGAFYTPPPMVQRMASWVVEQRPVRVVDTGCGSGRFAVALRRAGFAGEIVAVDTDPLAVLMTRAHVAAAGLGEVDARVQDFTQIDLPPVAGATAFLGNPPYVRHHDLDPSTKAEARETALKLGMELSGLAGLHALFLLAVARASRPGDLGCFVTSAEWMDTGYGQVMRTLLAGGLGLVWLDVESRRERVFEDALTTASVFGWRCGHRGEAVVNGSAVSRQELRRAKRWSTLGEGPPFAGAGIPLGSIARVHRGVATGANGFFTLRRERAAELGLERWTVPCLTRARQVIEAAPTVRAADCSHLLLDLDGSPPDNAALHSYLASGETQDLHQRYLCRHRQPWWRVGGKPPPPIVVTYMARRPPVFAFNPDGCRILNVLHGLYPREPLSDAQLAALVTWLNHHARDLRGHRTYQGGLMKWEPRDLEAAMIPPPDFLEKGP